MKIAKCTMTLKRETKGALLYERTDGAISSQEAALTNLYLRKAHVDKPYPDTITVEVSDGTD